MNKRSKNTRQRGGKTHGWGSMKKHRGAGNRGGRGLAGTGKRGDQRKPSIWKIKKYFGKHGFKKKNTDFQIIKTINLSTLDQSIPRWIRLGKIKEAPVLEINLASLGYQKLLSLGTLTKKAKITAFAASAKAIEKVKAAGGEVILPSKGEEPKKAVKTAKEDTPKAQEAA